MEATKAARASSELALSVVNIAPLSQPVDPEAEAPA
jgi:hypothetical protein